jgi:hypothetical protein
MTVTQNVAQCRAFYGENEPIDRKMQWTGNSNNNHIGVTGQRSIWRILPLIQNMKQLREISNIVHNRRVLDIFVNI